MIQDLTNFSGELDIVFVFVAQPDGDWLTGRREGDRIKQLHGMSRLNMAPFLHTFGWTQVGPAPVRSPVSARLDKGSRIFQ